MCLLHTRELLQVTAPSRQQSFQSVSDSMWRGEACQQAQLLNSRGLICKGKFVFGVTTFLLLPWTENIFHGWCETGEAPMSKIRINMVGDKSRPWALLCCVRPSLSVCSLDGYQYILARSQDGMKHASLNHSISSLKIALLPSIVI